MKLPSIPSRDDLTSQARGFAGQAVSGAAKAADTVSRAAVDTGRAAAHTAARTAAQTSQRLGVDRLPGLSGLSRLAQDDGAPADTDAGPRITGTPFTRALVTAFAADPHTRTAGSYLMGAGLMRTGFRMGGRERKQLKNNGFAPEATGANGLPELNVTELIHVHGRRVPNIIRKASSRFFKRSARRIHDAGLATGSLHWIGVSEQEQARGPWGGPACAWTPIRVIGWPRKGGTVTSISSSRQWASPPVSTPPTWPASCRRGYRPRRGRP